MTPEPSLALHYQQLSETGKVRQVNEDGLLVAWWPDYSSLLVVIADGMGGHSGGEEASRIVIDVFRGLVSQPLPPAPVERYETFLRFFYEADQALRDRAAQDLFLQGMGATVVAGIVSPTECLHLHAGDCRLYQFRENRLRYVTTDHSVVQVLVETGRLDPGEANQHPMRSVVNSCLGGGAAARLSIEPRWAPDQDSQPAFLPLLPGDMLLFCTDGLTSEVDDHELQELGISCGPDASALATFCLRAALEAGGHDNITVVTVLVPPENVSDAAASMMNLKPDYSLSPNSHLPTPEPVAVLEAFASSTEAISSQEANPSEIHATDHPAGKSSLRECLLLALARFLGRLSSFKRRHLNR